MVTLVILAVAVSLIALVLYWSGRYGGQGRTGGTSLRRSPRAHTTVKGQPKVAYATRDEAEMRARALVQRDGSPMSVYRCDTCAKWHVGHQK